MTGDADQEMGVVVVRATRTEAAAVRIFAA